MGTSFGFVSKLEEQLLPRLRWPARGGRSRISPIEARRDAEVDVDELFWWALAEEIVSQR